MKNSMLCAVALTLSGAFAANAGEAQPQMAVHYGDLQVEKTAGAQILFARIHFAANVVCGPAPSIRELNAWQAYESCTKSSIDQAIASLPFDLMARLNSPHDSETLAQR